MEVLLHADVMARGGCACPTNAPYINKTLLPCFASASAFTDELPLADLSEPHYVWMESGSRTFSDVTFATDDDPSASNSTASAAHLSAELDNANLSWRGYQEGYDPATTGACPITSAALYAAKHNPFVFFQGVSGSPPSAGNPTCAAHFKGFPALATDLAGAGPAKYNFITPNLCNDMHGATPICSTSVTLGDAWLASNLPPILAFANANDGVVFLVWDEGDQTGTMPFIAMGPGVKRNYVSAVAYTHGSMLKTNERILLGKSSLPTVAAATDLADLFEPGALP